MKAINVGDRLIAKGGNRRVDIERRGKGLWAVPVNKNDGMMPMHLKQWLGSIVCGARKITKRKRNINERKVSV